MAVLNHLQIFFCQFNSVLSHFLSPLSVVYMSTIPLFNRHGGRQLVKTVPIR